MLLVDRLALTSSRRTVPMGHELALELKRLMAVQGFYLDNGLHLGSIHPRRLDLSWAGRTPITASTMAGCSILKFSRLRLRYGNQLEGVVEVRRNQDWAGTTGICRGPQRERRPLRCWRYSRNVATRSAGFPVDRGGPQVCVGQTGARRAAEARTQRGIKGLRSGNLPRLAITPSEPATPCRLSVLTRWVKPQQVRRGFIGVVGSNQ